MRTTHPPSLRREIITWYSAVLLAALIAFAAVAYLILRESLERAETASLDQTARAAEQLLVPVWIPRVEVGELRMTLPGTRIETLRRRVRLATGQEVEIYVAGSGDVGRTGLRAFLMVSLLLIPLTAIAAALGGRVIANRLLRPLNQLVHATRGIGIGGLSQRVEEPERPAELRELARDFNGMLARLDSAVGALRRFTADASHELRTPLTVIRGTTQVALARPRSADELRETLEEVAEETERMLHLVEGLLTLARGEQAGIEGVREHVELLPLLEDACELGKALAAEKSLDVRLVAPATVAVQGSPTALRQVFLNLVSNAVKFTDQGNVTITVRDEPDCVEVRVADTGRGIKPDELPHVFERFYRGDASRGTEGGFGLGLAIARLIVEQHGGRIEVQSVPGQGSNFRVQLPRAAA